MKSIGCAVTGKMTWFCDAAQREQHFFFQINNSSLSLVLQMHVLQAFGETLKEATEESSNSNSQPDTLALRMI